MTGGAACSSLRLPSKAGAINRCISILPVNRAKDLQPASSVRDTLRPDPTMRLIRHLFPAMGPFRRTEQVRAAGGAVLGLAVCGLITTLTPVAFSLSEAIIAPMGASAVLLFAAPNSPLAQPWSAMIGNMSSALTALLVIAVVPAPWTAAVAVGLAILVMMLLRALHPPGGAVALLSTLDPDPVLNAGIWFAIGPVGVSTMVLVGSGCHGLQSPNGTGLPLPAGGYASRPRRPASRACD